MELKDYVTTIPDFPKPGVMFRDITTIVNNDIPDDSACVLVNIE